MNIGPCLVITISLVALLGVLASFYNINIGSTIPQDISPHSGFLVWHPPIKDYDQQLIDSTALFTVITTFLSGYYILKWTTTPVERSHVTFFVLGDSKTVSIDRFNYFLGIYCLFTSGTALVLLWFDVGKLWSVTGIFHNVCEILIMLLMHQGGRITSNVSVWWMGFYVVFATSFCLFLSWPYDAIWFKMQGLCPDFAIFIQFVRAYFNTKRHLRDDDIKRNPNEEGLVKTDEELHPPESFRVYRPQQLLLLAFASIAHIIGNVEITIYLSNITDAIFLFSYGIAFPTYAYFVYINCNVATSSFPHRLIYLPDTALWKVVAVTIFSITLSLSTIRMTFLVASINK